MTEQKALQHKYIRRYPGKGGKWRYVYVKQPDISEMQGEG